MNKHGIKLILLNVVDSGADRGATDIGTGICLYCMYWDPILFECILCSN
ncbi:hypothetical protein LEMLEM_LOCUS1225, partial [Lemmus lemmus]